MRQLLRRRKALKRKEIGYRITLLLQLTLPDGRRTHDAVFQVIEEQRMIANLASGGGDIYFTDSQHFKIAACNMAEWLGVDDRIPVTIEREYRGSFLELM